MLGVTIFGIFLTPVFFYVIQGFGEVRLFAGVEVRRALSALAGGALGAAIGYLLAKLRVGVLPWGPIVGGAGGVLLLVGAFEVRRRIKRMMAPAALPPIGNCQKKASSEPPGLSRRENRRG
jgi:multidrug efflux pump